MPIQVPVTQTGLEASIQAAAQRAGRNLKIDLGVSSRSIGSLSQPLGKITGQADQFTRSMEAANARVLAFGASVGVLSAISRGFKEIIATTIQVEKNMADINSVLGTTSGKLNKFKNDIFSVAKETGNSFQTVSDAALELSRQGLGADDVLRRLKDSMILSRLSGLDAASAVEGLTAAVNSFSKEGVTTSDVLNKISNTAAKFSVSERDLIEGFKRSASVAQQAGVSLDELGGIITAVQQKTARGGAVIGNAFKTIFTRIQRPDSLAALQDIGAAVTDAQGGILPATKLIENLAGKINSLNDIQKANITEKIGGGFQVGPLIAALDDLTSKTSTFKGATEAMATAGTEAYKRNTALNQTLAASINMATVNLQELANTLGEIGVTDSLKNILSFFNSFATNVKDILQGEGLGSDFAKGIVKGIGAVLSGPGLLIFGAIIGKLLINFVQFGAVALKTFFNIGSAAKEIGAIQSTIASTLLNNKAIQTQILALEGNRVAQAQFFTTALNTQLATMEKMRTIAASIAPAVYGATTGSGKPRAAGGYMPTVMAEANDIRKGIGGARPSDRPVVIPNFAFGGGKTGTMVANTGEHIVPNYGGGGGSAVFNRDMAGRMGLPSGARKIGAAGGFIPNFAVSIKDATTQSQFDSLYSQYRYAKNAVEDAIRYEGTARGLAAAKASQKIQAGKAQKQSSTLYIDAQNDLGGIGVVSISGPKNANTTERITGGSFVGGAKKFVDNIAGEGRFTAVEMSNIELRNLENLQNLGQRDFRQKVKNRFTTPLYQLAGDILPNVFSGNDAADYSDKLLKSKNSDPALFSDAVLGGIFESAVRMSTKSVKQIEAFDTSDDKKPFDFEEGGAADKKFKEAFAFQNALYKADAKKTAEKGTGSSISSVISKSLRDPGTQAKILSKKLAKKAASGFIPNFASEYESFIGNLKNSPVESWRVDEFENSPSNPEIRKIFNKYPNASYLGSGAENYAFSTGKGNVIKIRREGYYSDSERKEKQNNFTKFPWAKARKILSSFAPNLDLLGNKIAGNLTIQKLSGPVLDDVVSPEKAKQIVNLIGKNFESAQQQDSSNILKAVYLDKASNKNFTFTDSSAKAKSLEYEKLPEQQIYSKNKFGLIDVGLHGHRVENIKNAVRGFIPNFADPLKEAISREVGAGVNPSQVYVDQNNSLKSPMNPSGLMVANRRDEPSGGMQGISRARKEGANPMTYGAADGFIPNYADLTMKDIGSRSKPLESNLDALNQKIKELNDSISKNKITYDEAQKELSQFVSNIPKITSTTASKATTAASSQINKPEEKPRKDYLGALIGLQIATSFLSGTFTDASAGAGLFAKRLTDAAAGLSSALFAFEGLKSIGKEGGRLSSIMGKIGVAGQVATIAFQGFSLGMQLYRDWTGATAAANKSTAAFTDAVNAAGVSLNSLSQVKWSI